MTKISRKTGDYTDQTVLDKGRLQQLTTALAQLGIDTADLKTVISSATGNDFEAQVIQALAGILDGYLYPDPAAAAAAAPGTPAANNIGQNQIKNPRLRSDDHSNLAGVKPPQLNKGVTGKQVVAALRAKAGQQAAQKANQDPYLQAAAQFLNVQQSSPLQEAAGKQQPARRQQGQAPAEPQGLSAVFNSPAYWSPAALFNMQGTDHDPQTP
jgi:hypothetical protein